MSQYPESDSSTEHTPSDRYTSPWRARLALDIYLLRWCSQTFGPFAVSFLVHPAVGLTLAPLAVYFAPSLRQFPWPGKHTVAILSISMTLNLITFNLLTVFFCVAVLARRLGASPSMVALLAFLAVGLALTVFALTKQPAKRLFFWPK